jgi:hypothetical protein
MVPGQARDEHGNFDYSDDRLALMVGYADDYDVFILWDATLHRDFAFSTNAQVRTETVAAARETSALMTQQRRLRLGNETVIAAPSNLLAEAIGRRFSGAGADLIPAVEVEPERVPRDTGGRPYEPPARDEAAQVPVARVFEVDPDVIDRGTTAHKDVQDALAQVIAEHDLEPLSPRPGDPKFDVAWVQEGVAFVAEVKSLTDANEERQLRLGLGQVLSYVHILEWPNADAVRAVLAVERKPTADYWTTLCAEHEVILTWPGNFDDLFSEPI